MKYFKKYLPHILIFLLIISSIGVWYMVFTKNNQSDLLKVAFLDVGQGDAIYIEAPNGKQMLIDGGGDAKILRQLAKVMPFGDRSIDIILATHTDVDHIGGFSFVLRNYKVGDIIENGASSQSSLYRDFEQQIKKKKIKKIIANNKIRIILDKEKNIYFDILSPDKNISKMSSNDGSIVGKLVYNNKSFMLTGDATKYTENLIGWNENFDKLHSNILKLGHHGSKNSSSLLWLERVHPSVAIVSAGKNNRYGHPHKKTLDKLKFLKIPYLETSKLGNIIFETDGISLFRK